MHLLLRSTGGSRLLLLRVASRVTQHHAHHRAAASAPLVCGGSGTTRGMGMTTTTKTMAAASAAGDVGGGDLKDQKKATRKEVRAALKTLTEEEMARQSEAIAAHIVHTLPLFNNNKDATTTTAAGATTDATTTTGGVTVKLGMYVHCAKLREVDTTPLLRAALALPNVKLFVPIVDEFVTPSPSPSDPAAASSSDATTTTTTTMPTTTTTPAMRFLRITSLEDDLEPKCMGILEPTEMETDGVTPRENLEAGDDAPLDLLLMPGLAFDAAGNRLGRGRVDQSMDEWTNQWTNEWTNGPNKPINE